MKHPDVTSAQEPNDALQGIFSARVKSSTAVYQRRGVRRLSHSRALPLSSGAALAVSSDAFLDRIVIMVTLAHHCHVPLLKLNLSNRTWCADRPRTVETSLCCWTAVLRSSAVPWCNG